MPSSAQAIGGKNYDGGTTNVRRTHFPHWQPWLDVAHRCVVPATSFCEPDQVGGTFRNIWFALDGSRPLFFFAGIWTPQWTSVRKVKEGSTTSDLYAFLTADANAEVATYHEKAMPVSDTAIVLSKLTLLAVVGGNEVSNPFFVTEVYVKQGDTWKLGALSFTRRVGA